MSKIKTIDPVGIFLVSSGPRGIRLLFRYPFDNWKPSQPSQAIGPQNPFKRKILPTELYYLPAKSAWSAFEGFIQDKRLVGFPDEVLGTLLAAGKSDRCGKKYLVKINDVVFVGFPMQYSTSEDKVASNKQHTIFINIVFALPADVDASVIECYQRMSRSLSVALIHEDTRCYYLSRQKQLMWTIQDEVATEGPEGGSELKFDKILRRCSLGKCLKSLFDDLCQFGYARFRVNQWVPLNFCCLSKVDSLSSTQHYYVQPSDIARCFRALRPYHTVLLLEDRRTLLKNFCQDTSPLFARLLRVCSHRKSLRQIAFAADITLYQVFQFVGELLYWGKAMIIHPIRPTNVYILSPQTQGSIVNYSAKSEEFRKYISNNIGKNNNTANSFMLADALALFSHSATLADHAARLKKSSTPLISPPPPVIRQSISSVEVGRSSGYLPEDCKRKLPRAKWAGDQLVLSEPKSNTVSGVGGTADSSARNPDGCSLTSQDNIRQKYVVMRKPPRNESSGTAGSHLVNRQLDESGQEVDDGWMFERSGQQRKTSPVSSRPVTALSPTSLAVSRVAGPKRPQQISPSRTAPTFSIDHIQDRSSVHGLPLSPHVDFTIPSRLSGSDNNDPDRMAGRKMGSSTGSDQTSCGRWMSRGCGGIVEKNEDEERKDGELMMRWLGEVVIWLLKHRLVYQRHTYVQLFVPEDCELSSESRLDVESKTGDDAGIGGESYSSVVSFKNGANISGSATENWNVSEQSEPDLELVLRLMPRLSRNEAKAISMCPASRDHSNVHLLARLSEYFDERYHVEAMMLYEKLDHETIISLIDKYRDILAVFSHAETDITYWLQYT